MGQKNSRIENTVFEAKIVSTKESSVRDYCENFGLKFKQANTNQNKYQIKKNENKVSEVLKKNASETFAKNWIQSRRQSSVDRDKKLIVNQLPVKKSFVNNFYVFLNKDNRYWSDLNQNRSASYFIPDKGSERNDSKAELNNFSKRSKSIPEITESVISKLDMYQIDKFTELEIKTIQLTYKFIKDDLNSVGVIAFMKYFFLNKKQKFIFFSHIQRSFETLPDIQDKFDAFKFLPIDELSKSHALR